MPEGFLHLARRELSELVRSKDPDSTIEFLEANHDFDEAEHGQWGVAAFYRFMLPDLLPNLGRIIYADDDVLFLEGLDGLAKFDLGDNLLAAVKNAGPVGHQKAFDAEYGIQSDEWINSGVLVMDLKKLRASGIYGKWVEFARQGGFTLPDQDILQITCKGRTAFLPLKYNYKMIHTDNRGKEYIGTGVVFQAEFDEARKSPVILHYLYEKPWDDPPRPGAALWWRHAARTPFFEALNLRCLKGLAMDAIKAVSVPQSAPAPQVVRIVWRLFGFLPLLVKKESRERDKWYLFGFILLFRVKKKIA